MPKQRKIGIADYVRALRLPFSAASILPFIAGSFLARGAFRVLPFALGLIATLCTHLAANLLNDYADSKSGADWQDKAFYGFFGGSKLIQEQALSERFYLLFSAACFATAFVCVVMLALFLKTWVVIGYYAVIVFLGFSYSHKPLQLSYRRLGEAVIFLLFGCAPFMGAYFIQTSRFPALESFVVSLPFGFFATAILFANEVPDFATDAKAGKVTWVSFTGAQRGHILYRALAASGYFSVALAVALGYLSWVSLCSLVFVMLSLRAADTLKTFPRDKLKLVESSKLTIAVQALVSFVIILDLFL